MRTTSIFLLICLTLAAQPFRAAAASTLYGLGVDGVLYKADPANVAHVTAVGPVGSGIAVYDRAAIAYNPEDKNLYAVARLRGTNDYDLVKISPTTAELQVIARIPSGKYEAFVYSTSLKSCIASFSSDLSNLDYTASIYKISTKGETSLVVKNNMDNDVIAWDSDKAILYSSDPNGDGVLVRVDMTTGVNTRLTTVSGDLDNITYNPDDHLLYGTIHPETATTASMVTINPATGETKDLGTIGGPVTNFTFAYELPASAAPPSFPAAGVVDASSAGSHIAQGALFSIYGTDLAPSNLFTPTLPLPSLLNGVSIDVIDGNQVLKAGMLFVSPMQINAQMPFGLSGGPVQIKVNTAAGASAAVSVTVAPEAPSFYTKTANGQGEAILLHGNYTLVSEQAPAMPGEIIIGYVNGLGPQNPLCRWDRLAATVYLRR